MEVHIRNVHKQTNTRALRDVYSLNSKSFRFGAWTIRISKAQKFLDHYGQTKSGPGAKPFIPINRSLYKQLKLHGKPIYFVKSTQAPYAFHLRNLAQAENDRQLMIYNVQEPRPRQARILPVIFSTSLVSCGSWAHFGNQPVFNPQLDLQCGGTIKFGEWSIILILSSGQRLDFRYAAVDTIVADDSGISPSFIISMHEPPRLFEKIADPVEDLLSQLGINGTKPAIINNRKRGPERHRLPYLSTEQESIVGHCLVYRVLLLKPSTGALGEPGNTMQKLSKAPGLPNMVFIRIQIQRSWETYADSFQLLHEEITRIRSDIPFEVAFQVQKLAKNNYLPPYTVLALLPTVVKMFQRSGVSVTVGAIQKLFPEIPWAGPNVDGENFELQALKDLLISIEGDCLKNGLFGDHSVTQSNSDNVALIHRVKVSPAGIYLSGPTPESNNRVLRKYAGFHSYFLRVQFHDEDGTQVSYHPKVSNYKIFHERFETVLQNGIIIGGRQYSFLGFSHSSLRMHSCWFSAPFRHNGIGVTDRSIIRELGDFSTIRSPAKCAARIGQAFSDTRIAVPIEDRFLNHVNDVESNGRVFSDGVGTMSTSVMESIWEKLPSKHRLRPTCLQMRYKGAKGMISVDTRLSGNVLNLRPSMIKFDGSTSVDIEICDAAYKPLPVKLNRQLIKIMEDMGVPRIFFLENQEKEVETLRRITDNPINASSFLTRQKIGEGIRLPWLISKLAIIGLDFRRDGFLRDVLEVTLLTELRLLKHKTKIPVENGWHLHGLMDETGFLEEGQIFCVVVVDGKRNVVIGDDILVSRAPALHPGDVQLAQAVLPPADSPLLQLTNCVCFSQKGSRDLPSMLSGGDLDGDRYYVIWDELAKPKTTFPPADYPRLDPVDIERTVEKKDMTNHFIEFMETDQLGRIAVLHRVLADQKEEGVLSEECLRLADMHSTAVDFSKTGIPVDMTKMPKYNNFRPDFEAPGPHIHIESRDGITFDTPDRRDPEDVGDDDEDFSTYRFYRSEKVLGELYRAIDEREIFEGIQRRSLNRGVTSLSTVIHGAWQFVKNTCRLIEWTHQIEWARGIRDMYEDCISNIMINFTDRGTRPLSELEAFAGNILGKTGVPNRQQRELATSMKEQFETDCVFIVDCITKEGHERSDESLERSMACLSVSLEDHTTPKKAQLLSFKYVAAAVCLREVEIFLNRG